MTKNYTVRDIEQGLRHPDYWYAKAYDGDLTAIHHLADSQLALDKADPTLPQLKAVELVWKQGYTLQEAGDILGITPQAVRFNLQLLSIKLQKIVDHWTAENEGEPIYD